MTSSPITRTQAEAVRALVQKQYAEYVSPSSPKGPVLLVEDGRWLIVWEEGPYEWVYTVFGGGGMNREMYEELTAVGIQPDQAKDMSTPPQVELPHGISYDVVNHYSICLFRD